jgi:hypothetical protein
MDAGPRTPCPNADDLEPVYLIDGVSNGFARMAALRTAMELMTANGGWILPDASVGGRWGDLRIDIELPSVCVLIVN